MFSVKEMLYSRNKDGKRVLRIIKKDGMEISKEYEYKDIPEEFKILEDCHNDAIFACRKFNDLRYYSAIDIDYENLPLEVKEKVIEELRLNKKSDGL